MQMSHRRPRAAASLGLLHALLLLEPPELGLDGDRGLFGLGVFHVDVKVLRDVRRLGRI